MSATATVQEIILALMAGLKEAITGVKQALKDTAGLLVEKSKLEGKLGKAETKLAAEKEKGKSGGKKASAASNSAAAAPAVETGSTGSEKALTITAAKELPEARRLAELQEQLGQLQEQLAQLKTALKSLPKSRAAPASNSSSSAAVEAEPKGPANAYSAWPVETLFAKEWAQFQEDHKEMRESLTAEKTELRLRIKAMDKSDPDLAGLQEELKVLTTQHSRVGSFPVFKSLCRETHKEEWLAFKLAFDKPREEAKEAKKAEGGGGSP
jgi:hypothetical protein